MSFKNNFIAYLAAYSDKNLQKVSDMFASNIALRDWKISVVGKEAAISETAKNFRSADSLEIDVLNICESADAVAGELRITVDQSEVLYVVDVVTYNPDGKIQSIRAYLGRGN